MESTTFSLFILLFLSLLSPALADSYVSRVRHSNSPQEYYDPTLPTLPPLPTPTPTPTPPTPCSTHPLFSHSFTNTHSFSTPYSPPPACPSPWSHVTLSLSLSLPLSLRSSPNHSYRIAAIWLGSSEILRTSTPGPTDSPASWHVTKDVTPYSSLLNTTTNITMAFDNSANDTSAAFHVNATLHFYTNTATTAPPPADLILPISNSFDNSSGFWFRVANASDPHSAKLKIPTNAYKAVLEVYVSFHGDEDFWYLNIPDSYVVENNLAAERGNGAFRLVRATIDSLVAGSVVPFPVIYSGGINPLFWDPVVAIGAFDLPTYDFDITPFLGVLLDGASHEFGLRVADAVPFWLVDANLHLWLDQGPGPVAAKLIRFGADSVSVKRKSDFRRLTGTFKVKAESEHRFVGWVKSSTLGNVTTDVKHEMKLKHSVELRDDGRSKKVEMKAEMKTDVRVTDERGSVVSELAREYEFPLSVDTTTTRMVGKGNDTYTVTTSLSHDFVKESKLRSGRMEVESTVNDRQDAGGWMVVKGRDVILGSAQTEQVYRYRDNGRCYDRRVRARDGQIVSDLPNAVCSSGNLMAAA